MFISPAILQKNSIWELGANVTLSGLVIVFLGLIVLVLVLYAFSAFFSRRTPVARDIVSNSIQRAVQNVSVAGQNEEDPNEIIAVIAAAVDAIYSGSGKKAVIRSVRPSAVNGRPIWATAGIIENTRAF